MRLCIAALALFFFARSEAEPRCNLYFADDRGIMALDKTSTEPYVFKQRLRDERGRESGHRVALDKKNGRLVYSLSGGNQIRATDIDGTGDSALSFVRDECSSVEAIAVDPKNVRLLGVCQGNGQGRGSLLVGPSDGSSLLEWKPAFGEEIEFLLAIAYDPETEKAFVAVQTGIYNEFMDLSMEETDERMYYIVTLDVPKSGTFSGVGATVLYETGHHVESIDIDTSNGYIYWTSYYHGVFRAPIDGSGPQERLYSQYDFVSSRSNWIGALSAARIDAVNQVLYIATRYDIYRARADGKGAPQVVHHNRYILNDLAVDCNDSRDGLPLLAHCSSNDECFFNGICTGRVGKLKKCRFCARKNQVCDSHDDCCQSPSGRYCHPVKRVCKRRPHLSREFGQCPAGSAFSSISEKGTPLAIGHPYYTYAEYDENYVELPVAAAVDLPFEFPWFGSTVNRTYVTYCGTLGMAKIDDTIPSVWPGSLNLPGGPIWPGGMRGQTIPRVSVIGERSWNGPIYMHKSSTSITISWEDAGFVGCMKACHKYGSMNAQITLFDDGRVVMCWGNVSGDPSVYYGSRERVYAGIEDDSLGFHKPAVVFLDNPFDEGGESGKTEDFANQCACFV